MVKLLGCIMILAASSGIGFIYGERFKKRTKQLTELQRSIHQLQNEIVYTYNPLPEAILNVAKKGTSPIKNVFEEVSDLLFKNKVDNVYEAFKAAIDDKRGILNLKKEDVGILLDLSKSLGETDIEGQQRMFSLVLENIKKNIKNSEILMSKNVKMYRYLGFSLGAMIVIILV